MIGAGIATLSAIRLELAGVLEPQMSGDPEVLPYFADAVAPPALMIQWADPWLEADPTTGQSGRYIARLEVYAITPRLEPEAAAVDLEQMVSLVIRRLDADAYPWQIVQVDAPGAGNVGGVEYKACRIQVRAPATPNEEV